MSNTTKSILRSLLKSRRAALTAAMRQQFSSQICQNIQTLSCYKAAMHIGLYSAIQTEVNLAALTNDASTNNKQYYFPIIDKYNNLQFLPTNVSTIFHVGAYHILEPNVPLDQAIILQQLDMLFLPMLGFNMQGARLGYGGGYYDRLLQAHRPNFLVGVAYDEQYMPTLVPDSWDVTMDLIITQTQTIWIKENFHV